MVLVLSTLLITCGTGSSVDPEIKLGREIFNRRADPTCSSCHSLNDAGTNAVVGPNLDELRPDSARVSVAVRYGVGIMPPQVGILDDDEIAAVARYVARVTHRQPE